MPVDNRVVVSRIQNRRGSQAEFDALYAPGADDNFKLQSGEIGLILDTQRVFIGSDDINHPIEFQIGTLTDLFFSPINVNLGPSTGGGWTSIDALSVSPTNFLDILYS